MYIYMYICIYSKWCKNEICMHENIKCFPLEVSNAILKIHFNPLMEHDSLIWTS